MKKLITSRRGVAIELAIGVLLVMSALGIILVTNASLQNKEMKSDVSRFEQKIELYEITDYIISGSELPTDYEHITTPVTENEIEYTVHTVKKGDDIILTFKTMNVEGKEVITSWN